MEEDADDERAIPIDSVPVIPEDSRDIIGHLTVSQPKLTAVTRGQSTLDTYFIHLKRGEIDAPLVEDEPIGDAVIALPQAREVSFSINELTLAFKEYGVGCSIKMAHFIRINSLLYSYSIFKIALLSFFLQKHRFSSVKIGKRSNHRRANPRVTKRGLMLLATLANTDPQDVASEFIPRFNLGSVAIGQKEKRYLGTNYDLINRAPLVPINIERHLTQYEYQHAMPVVEGGNVAPVLNIPGSPVAPDIEPIPQAPLSPVLEEVEYLEPIEPMEVPVAELPRELSVEELPSEEGVFSDILDPEELYSYNPFSAVYGEEGEVAEIEVEIEPTRRGVIRVGEELRREGEQLKRARLESYRAPRQYQPPVQSISSTGFEYDIAAPSNEISQIVIAPPTTPDDPRKAFKPFNKLLTTGLAPSLPPLQIITENMTELEAEVVIQANDDILEILSQFERLDVELDDFANVYNQLLEGGLSDSLLITYTAVAQNLVFNMQRVMIYLQRRQHHTLASLRMVLDYIIVQRRIFNKGVSDMRQQLDLEQRIFI